jgi:DNA-binding transcriptional LysR family regulator
MRLEWLEDILSVAETGSLSEAAERRNLTQSAFSRRVQAIEDHVGVALFERARKPVQLRATTADQLDEITRLSRELRQLVADLRRGDRVSRNRVVLASQHALTTSLTPDLLRWLGTRAPDAYVRLRSANHDECFGQVLSRQADMALVYRVPGQEPLIEGDFLDTLVLGQDRLVPVFAQGEGAALNARFQAGELPYIAYPGEVFLGQALESAVMPKLRRMVQPVPRAETALTLAALELAAVGVGVAWVPHSIARAKIAAGTLVDGSKTLPSLRLEVTAVRIAARYSAAQEAIWSHLMAVSDAVPSGAASGLQSLG